ncbi:MAG: ABC transporter permease [Desulfovibrionales bacterium]
MRALYLMLFREFWLLRGQALAIAIVIGGGVATLVMSLSTLDSLRLTQDAFYSQYRFSEVFVSLKRAPESVADILRSIEGVRHVETRVQASANLDIPGFPDPATGRILSLPDGRNAALNRLFLRTGRLPDPEHDNEVVISEAFAQAHGFQPGDSLSAVINGRFQELRITGVALSPEYIYQIRPGDLFPDYERFGVLWMNRTPLAAAFDMEGAFNDVVMTVSRDARMGDVLDRLDEILDKYGSLGSIDRADQISHRYLSLELNQLATMATVFPLIFLGVSAFLLNVVMTRLIRAQRSQIAILKAFGYSNLEVGLHYMRLVLLICILGLMLGFFGGGWLGREMSELYKDFFHFPFLEYRLGLDVAIIGSGVTVAAALTGTISALHRAFALPPAEAMRPEPPPVFRPTLVERIGAQRLFSQAARMVLRNIERRPFKALFSIVGIALACGILMVGRFQSAAIDLMLDVQFGLAQRDDLTVLLVEPASSNVLFELNSLEGVDRAEPFRSSPVILHSGYRSYRTAIQGLPQVGDLRRVLDMDLRAVELPPEGLLLTDFLGEQLGVREGDILQVEFLEGRREILDIAVAGLIKEYMGVSAYMEINGLNRILREGDVVSGAHLAIDDGQRSHILEYLKNTPLVAGVSDRRTAVDNFMEQMSGTVLIFAFFSTLLAASIAFGVVYNNARITLAERSRELATLRVMGFTKGEIVAILIGELALLTIMAIPPGFLIGWGLIGYLVQGLQSELYRIPIVTEPSMLAFAATVILISALVSGLIVARKLYHLDLIAVLKSGE